MEISKNNEQDSYRQKLEEIKQLAEKGEYAESMAMAMQCVDEDFDDALALFMVGYNLLKMEKFGLAYNVFRRVAVLQPNRAEPWNNAGMCHQETWNLDDGEKCFRRALQLEPDKNVAALQNIALIHVNRCNPEEALKWCRRAEETKMESWETKDTKALALLMLRQWEEGWRLYDETAGRHKQRQLRYYSDPPEPRWRGEKGSVVVYGMQGIGDEISFASCIPDAMKKADVIIDCDKRLEGLFRRSFPGARVYGTRFKPRYWNDHADYSIPCDCLPHLFRNKNEDFPGTQFLGADPERRLQWRALFDTYKKPVIGIAWTGGVKHTGKGKRSLTLDDYKPILEAVDATWVSLEYRERPDDPRIKVFPRATMTNDYDDTAAMVAELDLVITVTTAVVHLSGGLGKECWCLAPNKPRWFYGLEGDMPWYKSVKMFRQAKDGKWPIDEIVRLLKLRYSCR